MVGHAVSGRSQLKEYCLRRLGFPVLEINIDDDQIEDLMDDAIQYFNERHYNGIEFFLLCYFIDISTKKHNDKQAISIYFASIFANNSFHHSRSA